MTVLSPSSAQFLLAKWNRKSLLKNCMELKHKKPNLRKTFTYPTVNNLLYISHTNPYDKCGLPSGHSSPTVHCIWLKEVT